MHTEYEVRILEIDPEDIKRRLEKANAKFEWDRLQKRYVYNFIPKIDGTQELEIEVDNFERCHLILKELGYEAKGYQENRRIQYDLNGVEIDIDSWPYIPTYLEIEGPSEEVVYKTVEVLGFKKENCTTLDVDGIYKKYGYDLEKNCDLKLEEERK